MHRSRRRQRRQFKLHGKHFLPRKKFASGQFSSNALSGAIAHLTAKCGGDVHDENAVNIMASSICFTPRNAADLGGKDSYFLFQDEPDQWIC
jgi:hypothetical protein